MTATIIPPATTTEAAPVRRTARPIPTTRLVKIELRKMFNTRSGFWMLVSIGVLSVIATGAVIIFAPDSAVTYENFATAIGLPMSVILPMIAILAVTSEWSQRSGLTTFTLVPSRGRVIGAKAIATVAGGRRLDGRRLRRRRRRQPGRLRARRRRHRLGRLAVQPHPRSCSATWSAWPSASRSAWCCAASAAAIVGYFVVSLVLPGILELLAQVREWFLDLQPWIDWNYTQVAALRGRHEHR